MNIASITVSFDKDIEFLKYNRKSINKFCSDYKKNIVVIYDQKQDCKMVKEWCLNNNVDLIIDKEARAIKRGYIAQQYIKLKADTYFDNDIEFVLNIDSDSIFIDNHSPDIFFIENKPVIVKNNYEMIDRNFKKHIKDGRVNPTRWKKITEEVVGFDVDFEYMFMMPLIYPVHILKQVRRKIEQNHKTDLLNYMISSDKFSEFNVIGAYCEKFFRDHFFWIDRWKQQDILKEYQEKVSSVFKQYSRYQVYRKINLNERDNEIRNYLGGEK